MVRRATPASQVPRSGPGNFCSFCIGVQRHVEMVPLAFLSTPCSAHLALILSLYEVGIMLTMV